MLLLLHVPCLVSFPGLNHPISSEALRSDSFLSASLPLRLQDEKRGVNAHHPSSDTGIVYVGMHVTELMISLVASILGYRNSAARCKLVAHIPKMNELCSIKENIE